MFRYLAACWDGTPTAQEIIRSVVRHFFSRNPNAETVIDATGLVLLACGSSSTAGRIYPLHDGHGAILGTIFHRPNSAKRGAASTFQEVETTKVLATIGLLLCTS
jgi:hypothetical protein